MTYYMTCKIVSDLMGLKDRANVLSYQCREREEGKALEL